MERDLTTGSVLKNIVYFSECRGKSSGRRHPHKGPSIKRGLSAELTGGVSRLLPPDRRSGGVFLIQKKSCPNGQLFLIGN